MAVRVPAYAASQYPYPRQMDPRSRSATVVDDGHRIQNQERMACTDFTRGISHPALFNLLAISPTPAPRSDLNLRFAPHPLLDSAIQETLHSLSVPTTDS